MMERFVDGLMDFAPSEQATRSDRINRLIDAALVEQNTQQKPRDYIGGSRLGVECMRALYYEHIHQQKDEGKDFDGRTLRIFRMGHLLEPEIADYLRKAGFDLRTHKQNGEQYGFTVAGGRIAGHIDGVIIEAPPAAGLDCPTLWECKTMKAARWKECKEMGLAKANPVYFTQVNYYCASLGLDNYLFTAYNKDTSEMHFESGRVDINNAQWASDRGVRVIEAKSPAEIPKVTRDKNDFRCKFCSYQDTCWK